MNWRLLAYGLFLAALSGCGPTYSPDTYASNAAQQAAKVEQGVIVGVRDVGISAAGTVGTVTGAAAGGIAGAQAGAGPISALTALGGSLVGGIAGSAVEHATEDTKAYEYIVRKPNGDLVSVTQKDKVPLVLGMKVLVIAGTQARVVPDYTVPPDVTAKVDKPAGQGAGSAPAPAKAAGSDAPAKPAEAGASPKPDEAGALAGKPDLPPSGGTSTVTPPPGVIVPGEPATPAAPLSVGAAMAGTTPAVAATPGTVPTAAASGAVPPVAGQPGLAAPANVPQGPGAPPNVPPPNVPPPNGAPANAAPAGASNQSGSSARTGSSTTP